MNGVPTKATVKQLVAQLATEIVPPEIRIRLRSHANVRRLMKHLFGGVAHCQLPGSRFQLFYEGYRNIGVGASIAHIEEQERAAVKTILLQLSPSIVWDVGANIGLWSLFLTDCCSAQAEIRCFEPDPTNLLFLNLNMQKNGLGNWKIRPLALSDGEGTSTFFSDPVCGATGSLNRDFDFIGNNFGAEREQFDVEVTTIDKEISDGAQAPQFLKIDVESHELAVLNGARRTLEQNRPIMLFETSRNHSQIAALLDELEYRLFTPTGIPIRIPEFSTIAIPAELDIEFS